MKTLVYGSTEFQTLRGEALKKFGVIRSEHFDAKSAVRQRIDYLKQTLRNTEMKGFTLGISGGVDSTTAGRLCQLACEELRSEGYFAQFIAMRLPSGIQKDEADAQEAIKFINADKTITVNIGEAARLLSDQGVEEIQKLEGNKITPAQEDFARGNIKARLRMTSQYHVSSLYSTLVLGTDHASEGIVGFFTKFADGACDLTVLDGINKTQVRMCAKELGAPEFLQIKTPTADLEDLAPQKSDSEGFGFEYWKLDAFLEGKEIDNDTELKIIQAYSNTQHKRNPIPGFTDSK